MRADRGAAAPGDKLGGAEEWMSDQRGRREFMIKAAGVAVFGAAAQVLPLASRSAMAQRGTGATGAVPVAPPTGTQLVLL